MQLGPKTAVGGGPEGQDSWACSLDSAVGFPRDGWVLRQCQDLRNPKKVSLRDDVTLETDCSAMPIT